MITPGPDADAGFGEGGPLKESAEDSFTVDIPEHGKSESAPDEVAPTSVGISFKITLVWSDPPGAALQNDLDLIVRAANGDERHGNMGTSSDFDRLNNVEQVAQFGHDLYEVAVHGENVASCGGRVPVAKGASDPAWRLAIYHFHSRLFARNLSCHFTGSIGAVVVHDDDLVNIVAIHLQKRIH